MRAPAAVQIVAAFITLAGSLGCGSSTPTEPTPPAPVYELKTSSFSGTVKTGGTVAFPFTVVNPGSINVSITALGPVSTLTMGITMGFWDPTTTICNEQAAAPSATLNVVYTATPSAPGEYCVGIFDTGNVQVSSDFTLMVTYY